MPGCAEVANSTGSPQVPPWTTPLSSQAVLIPITLAAFSRGAQAHKLPKRPCWEMLGLGEVVVGGLPSISLVLSSLGPSDEEMAFSVLQLCGVTGKLVFSQ